MHVVIVDIDGNPKPLPVTRLAGVDWLEINLLTKQYNFDAQYILILKEMTSRLIQKDCFH